MMDNGLSAFWYLGPEHCQLRYHRVFRRRGRHHRGGGLSSGPYIGNEARRV